MSQGSLYHTCLKHVRIQFFKNTHTNCTIGALSVTLEQEASHECFSFYEQYAQNNNDHKKRQDQLYHW